MNELVDKFMRYEAGDMEDSQEVFDFFQELVDTGYAWTLPGTYGRIARDLINMGYVTYDPEKEVEDA